MRLVYARALALLLPVLASCAHQVERAGTLATLHQVRPDTEEVPVDQGLDRAVRSYGDFLKQAPNSALAPEAMRRLADLKIEKEFGLQGDGKLMELPASQSDTPAKPVQATPVATTPLRAPMVAKVQARTATRSHPEAPGAGLSAAASEREL